MMGLELRVVIFQDGDMFIAQALELDVAAQAVLWNTGASPRSTGV